MGGAFGTITVWLAFQLSDFFFFILFLFFLASWLLELKFSPGEVEEEGEEMGEEGERSTLESLYVIQMKEMF